MIISVWRKFSYNQDKENDDICTTKIHVCMRLYKHNRGNCYSLNIVIDTSRHPTNLVIYTGAHH